MQGLRRITSRRRRAVHYGARAYDQWTVGEHAQRDYARAHPGLYMATFRGLHGRQLPAEGTADAFLRVFLAVLRGFGYEGDDAIHLVRCLRAAIGGFVALELRGGFALNVDVDESFRRLLALLAAGIDTPVRSPKQIK